MRCLLIDNYDSFTWNLADYLGRTLGEAPTVVYNDQYAWDDEEVSQRFDCIVVSPGPGTVLHEGDFNVSRRAVAQNRLPLLGVCLGFQGLGHFYGCSIRHAPEPVHGRTSLVRHQGDALFAGIPRSFEAVRYHSLIIDSPPVGPIQTIARSDDGLIMAIRHAQLPKWGVQFHPESILSQYGLELLTNFRDITRAYHGPKLFPAWPRSVSAPAIKQPPSPKEKLRPIVQSVSSGVEAVELFSQLFAEQPHCFWLDSQKTEVAQARYSFMGSVTADEVISYAIAEDDAEASAGHRLLLEMDQELTEVETENLSLPFCFSGGYVGYFSYEMKYLFGADLGHKSIAPDALWMRVRRFLAFDHQDKQVWLVALCRPDEVADGQGWVTQMADRVIALGSRDAREPRPPRGEAELRLDMALAKEDYLAAIAQCQRAIVEGESYEICLTNQFSLTVDVDPFALYCDLRSGNPGPFGAYLRSGETSILSCSPERFLRVLPGDQVQSKPIKGTMARSSDPQEDKRLAKKLAESVKDQAENLMIVDLLRNDLNRVAVPGSVEVPKLRHIESFQTLHHMVSTIEARLRPDRSLLDLVAAAFPGGSISGAPKIRSLQIIDRLEPVSRGVFCGSIGYLGYNRVADLNIAIRTASYDGSRLRFGAGGAITHLSCAAEEFQEILLKAEAILRPLFRHLMGDSGELSCRAQGNHLVCSAAT